MNSSCLFDLYIGITLDIFRVFGIIPVCKDAFASIRNVNERHIDVSHDLNNFVLM